MTCLQDQRGAERRVERQAAETMVERQAAETMVVMQVEEMMAVIEAAERMVERQAAETMVVMQAAEMIVVMKAAVKNNVALLLLLALSHLHQQALDQSEVMKENIEPLADQPAHCDHPHHNIYRSLKLLMLQVQGHLHQMIDGHQYHRCPCPHDLPCDGNLEPVWI